MYQIHYFTILLYKSVILKIFSCESLDNKFVKHVRKKMMLKLLNNILKGETNCYQAAL